MCSKKYNFKIIRFKRILRGIKLAVTLFFLNTGYIITILKIARLQGYTIIFVLVCGFSFHLTLQFSV